MPTPGPSPPPPTAASHPDLPAAKAFASPPSEAAAGPVPDTVHRKWPWIAGLALLTLAAIFVVPWVLETLRSVSTDDAYVNGHVTFVAPRVAGQVSRVLVDDNNVVHKGDLLVELDPEPYEVQVNIARAAVVAAEADLIAAEATVRGNEGFTRSLRFALEHAMEDVDDRIATLKLRAATLDSKRASLHQGRGRLQPREAPRPQWHGNSTRYGCLHRGHARRSRRGARSAARRL